VLKDCTFTGKLNVKFEGAAEKTLAFMMQMQSGGFASIIEPTLDRIKRGR
jgi:hypothetical protein